MKKLPFCFRAKLLSFALTYCDKERIQPVLQARCLLETKILYDQVNRAVNSDLDLDSSSDLDTRESPARAAIKQTQEILSSTKRTTSAVLSTLTDKKVNIVLLTDQL